MPRFRFRLERVLSIRRRQEERERLHFGLATRRRLQAAARLAEVQERMRAATVQAARLVAGPVTVEDLVRSHEYRLALLRREAESKEALAEAETRCEQARLALVAARRKRRVLERLRERRHEQWRYEEENAMQNELDEVGLAGFIRRTAEEGEARHEHK